MQLVKQSLRLSYLMQNVLNHDWTDGEVPGTMYGLSSNGWIDSELFHSWG